MLDVSTLRLVFWFEPYIDTIEREYDMNISEYAIWHRIPCMLVPLFPLIFQIYENDYEITILIEFTQPNDY